MTETTGSKGVRVSKAACSKVVGSFAEVCLVPAVDKGREITDAMECAKYFM